MSEATKINEVERERLEWFQVEADDGKTYRYERREQANDNLPLHIRSEFHPGVGIIMTRAKDKDGKLLLRQDEPGLPKMIRVEYLSGISSSGVSWGYWLSAFNYELVEG